MKKVLLTLLFVSSLFAGSICDMYYEKVVVQLYRMDLYNEDNNVPMRDDAYGKFKMYANEAIANCSGKGREDLISSKAAMKKRWEK